MASKGSLADLKRLRKQAAEAGSQQPAAATAVSASKKAASVHARTSGLEALQLSSQDSTLFRQTMKHVAPIKDTRRAILPPRAIAAPTVLKGRKAAAQGTDIPVSPAVSDVFTPASAAPDTEGYLKRGFGPDVLKNLRRDKWPIEASLDLHGSTLDQARERLDTFLQSCLTHGVKCVRIVHGKGYGSKEGTPVLKEAVRRWLTQFDAVLAYTTCNEQNGGSGAVQALLKKQT